MDPTGWHWSNNLSTSGFLTAADRGVYVISGAESHVSRDRAAEWRARDLNRSPIRAVKASSPTAGNLHVANGQIFVFDRTEGDRPHRRPSARSSLFGGADRRTLSSWVITR